MREKRKPQQTPGIAQLENQENNDFTLPASLYYDAVLFLENAKLSKQINEKVTDEHARSRNIYAEDRNKRAAIQAAFSFFEATINYIAFGHAAAHNTKLGSVELDVLEEKETILDENGHFIRRTKFYPLEARFLFLVQFLTGSEFDRSGQVWQRFRKAKALRDTWTHPKPPFDTWGLAIEEIQEAIQSLRDVLVKVSEMMIVERPLWLSDYETAAQELKKTGEIDDLDAI